MRHLCTVADEKSDFAHQLHMAAEEKYRTDFLKKLLTNTKDIKGISGVSCRKKPGLTRMALT
jgi:hypothetical protein